ncbi:hypothetical protein ACFVZ3_39805 [Kitasatospora purpeofusca]|uniref:hypothetical protein n=1 Tax=Kitasatospora purpeofusca TaxID=67352 RepID=UPI00364ECB46
MAIPDPWPNTPSPAELASQKAEWLRRREDADEAIAAIDTLLAAALDREDFARQWQRMCAGAVRHPLLAPGPPPGSAPARSAVALEEGTVLALMAQDTHRLWRAEDIRAALHRRSLLEVRTFLKEMAADGLLEEVRRKARHLLFRLPATALHCEEAAAAS